LNVRCAKRICHCCERAETGNYLVENAIILKASTAARISGCLALLDDSGFSLDALGGAPGGLFGPLAGGQCY